MRQPLLLPVLALAHALAAPGRAAAQGASPDPSAVAPETPGGAGAPAATARDRVPRPGEWAVGAWAGGAPTSYAGHFIGATAGRALALTGVRLGRETARLGPIGVELVAQLIPAAFAYDTPVGEPTTGCAPAAATPRAPSVRRTRSRTAATGYCRHRVYGFGLTPVGAQLAAPLGAHLRAFAAGNAGGMLFADNVPVPQARRLNFIFDFGGGVELGSRRGGAVTLGYKLHHISNAWTAPANPGVDNHVFYVGFVRRLRAAHAR